jgi:hypothetical protein
MEGIMACFLVPTAEAIVTTIVTKTVKNKEAKAVTVDSKNAEISEKIPFSRKLGWLNNMLWGGSALLAFEHLWHGEITPFFPFLTAAASQADTTAMLQEMATVGVAMAVIVTAIWGCMVAASDAIEKRASKDENAQIAENCGDVQ